MRTTLTSSDLRTFILEGCGNDQGEFKKLMWYGIVKEFNCKVTSTWSSCGREKDPFTHRRFGKGREGRTAQLDYIVVR